MNDNNQPTKKEQEEQAANKAGQLAGRAAADYLTGGQYEKLRNAPIAGKALQNAEKKVGDKVEKLDKATGGKIGKLAKKADDAGALDAADKGLSVVGGSMGDGKSINPSTSPKSATNTMPGKSVSSLPENNSSEHMMPKNNFAKNGLGSEGSDVVPNETMGGHNKALDDILGRKHSADQTMPSSRKKNKSLSGDSEKEESSANGNANVVVKRLAKLVMIPFVVGLVAFMLLTLAIVEYNEDSDLAAVDPEGDRGDATSFYATHPDYKNFYDRVVEVSEDYSKHGKQISTLYITATFHVMQEYNINITPDKMTKKVIEEWAEGMLGSGTVYNESTYREYLEKTLFPSRGLNETRSKRATDRVFQYIEQYLDKLGRSSSCTNTTGGTCEYSFDGVHGLNVAPFTISNLQVRLMSSSFCNGTDNVALKEDLVPFEKYVLGVTYGEIGQAFNTEVEKVHMIAARSFALARPYIMNGASGVKYVNEGSQQIIQLRACVADQVFCNTDLGCSKDVAAGNQYGIVYSGTSHPYVYKDALDNYPNSTLKSSWQETMGMVGVDKNNKVVEMGYYNGNGNKDDWVWKRWAEQGMDYVQIIMSAYPEISEIKKNNCSTVSETSDSSFLKIASTLWKKVVSGNYSYGETSIPPSGELIDCSSYVDWVLSEYGFSDFKGTKHTTQYFVNTNLNQAYGWQEISISGGQDVTNKLLPGDILVRDSGDNNGHMNIIVEVKADGSVWGYDCGSASNWRSSNNGEAIQISDSFVKSDSRPGKIIRISNVSGNNCNTAVSGEWSTWRQYAPAPWANIHLGNSSATIGGYGCFITSIAIQIARSGAQTILSDFNPGTFVQELNKYNSFDGSGSFIGAQNIPKIVPSFETVAHNVSIYGMSKQQKISTIQSYIDQGYYVILRVKYNTGQHWVAVTGTTNDGIQMVDPGSDATSVWDQYPVSESSHINVYKIG